MRRGQHHTDGTRGQVALQGSICSSAVGIEGVGGASVYIINSVGNFGVGDVGINYITPRARMRGALEGSSTSRA